MCLSVRFIERNIWKKVGIKMKTYQFTREAKYIEYGVVTANSKEEAIELIKNNDYDDIYDTSLEEEYNETIKIEEEEGIENE